VCSEMWKPYLPVIAKQANHTLHVLDHFHSKLSFNCLARPVVTSWRYRHVTWARTFVQA
jgi:hypothetical protein